MSLSWSPYGKVVGEPMLRDDVQLFVKWQRFPSNWKPAANTGVLFKTRACDPPKA